MRVFEDFYEYHLQKRCHCNQWHMPCDWCETGAWNEYEEWCLDEGVTPLTEKEYKDSLEMKLNRKHFAEFFRTDYYTVGVQFPTNDEFVPRQRMTTEEFQQWERMKSSNKVYTYKVPKDVELQLGDVVFVTTANDPDATKELKAVFVVKVNHEAEIEEDSPFSYKWIVGKFDDILAGYRANIEKDQNLKRGVHKLEQALERVSLRNQLKMAMLELDDDTKKELAGIFGMKNLALENGDGKSEEKSS